MATVRSLILMGNEKLSPSVAHFDIPAGKTCPGKSKLCLSKCYARKNRYLYPQIQERLGWALEQTKRADFVNRMVDELFRKGVLLMRWHCAGDIATPSYGRKMLEVMARSQHTSFWLYSRSWRVPTIFPILKAMAALKNCKVWLSADSETGYPPDIPEGAKVAWMQTDADDDLENADLVFLDHPMRKQPIPLAMLPKVCPTETPAGKERGVTCATCRTCWRG